MTRDFFDPTPDQQRVMFVDSATLRSAEKLIESCEHCNPEGAEIPFDNVLDRVTGSDPSVTSSSQFVREEDLDDVQQQLENYRQLRQLVDEWITLSAELSGLRLREKRRASKDEIKRRKSRIPK